MRPKSLFFPIVVLIILYTVAYAIVYLGYFHQYGWVYTILHFTAGFTIAAVVSILFRQYFSITTPVKNWIFLVSFALLIGVLWEFYELGQSWFFSAHAALDTSGELRIVSGYTDTLRDLFLDMLGALLFAAVFRPSPTSVRVRKSPKVKGRGRA